MTAISPLRQSKGARSHDSLKFSETLGRKSRMPTGVHRRVKLLRRMLSLVLPENKAAELERSRTMTTAPRTACADREEVPLDLSH